MTTSHNAPRLPRSPNVSLASWLWLPLSLSLLLTACGTEDETKPDAGTSADSAGTDATADVGADTGGADASADVTADGGVADAGGCGALPSCLNSKGQEDLGLCPTPASNYACVAGCCAAKVLCKSNADCTDKLGSSVCPDKRFTCGCDLGQGVCIQTVCGVDSDCATGSFCLGGGCSASPKAADLTAHLLRPFWVARPGDNGAAGTLLGVQARSAAGIVAPDATFTWKLDGDGFTIKDGELTATAAAGKATVVATVVGGKASAKAQLWNLGPVATGDALRVVVIDERGATPVSGKVVVVGLADQATPDQAQEAPLKDGVVSFKAVKWPVDVHVIGDTHDAVSVLRFTATGATGDLVIATRLQHFADLAFDGDGKTIEKDTELIHGDVLSGKIAYSGQGEAALGITSVGVGSDLLLFNLDAIIGPSVKRPFDDKAPSMVNPTPGLPQDIPGGVSFLLGAPVVSSYLIAAPPGKHVIWSLSGRLGLNELLSQVSAIVSAVEGGLDVGKVVGVLLPYLSGFYSQVVMDVPFADKNAVGATVSEKDLAPDVPLGLFATMTPPKLPQVKEGEWSDLMLVLAGAMLPSGELVPLGLSAGSDTAEKTEKADGVVDGDPETPGNQDVELTYAPLHGGLRVGKNNHILVTAAITVAGGGKKEGGSIIFGEVGPLATTQTPGEFLPYPKTSTYDLKTRALTVSEVPGAQFYRTVLTGPKGVRWQVLMAKGMATKTVTLPDLMTWGAKADLGKAPKRVFVGAFELRTARTFVELFKPDGLIDLVRQVKRTSFMDVH